MIPNFSQIGFLNGGIDVRSRPLQGLDRFLMKHRVNPGRRPVTVLAIVFPDCDE